VHAKKGLWATEGGYEYNLVLLASAFAVTAVGPGRWSLDHVLGISNRGTGWALVELAAGVAGALVALAANQLIKRTTERSDYGTPRTTH
jgi:putative oxidoreductase